MTTMTTFLRIRQRVQHVQRHIGDVGAMDGELERVVVMLPDGSLHPVDERAGLVGHEDAAGPQDLRALLGHARRQRAARRERAQRRRRRQQTRAGDADADANTADEQQSTSH